MEKNNSNDIYLLEFLSHADFLGLSAQRLAYNESSQALIATVTDLVAQLERGNFSNEVSGS